MRIARLLNERDPGQMHRLPLTVALNRFVRWFDVNTLTFENNYVIFTPTSDWNTNGSSSKKRTIEIAESTRHTVSTVFPTVTRRGGISCPVCIVHADYLMRFVFYVLKTVWNVNSTSLNHFVEKKNEIRFNTENHSNEKCVAWTKSIS